LTSVGVMERHSSIGRWHLRTSFSSLEALLWSAIRLSVTPIPRVLREKTLLCF
jgi:hypothetical protein